MNKLKCFEFQDTSIGRAALEMLNQFAGVVFTGYPYTYYGEDGTALRYVDKSKYELVSAPEMLCYLDSPAAAVVKAAKELDKAMTAFEKAKQILEESKKPKTRPFSPQDLIKIYESMKTGNKPVYCVMDGKTVRLNLGLVACDQTERQSFVNPDYIRIIED